MTVDPQLVRLSDLLPESMLFLDRTGTILWANAAAKQLLQGDLGEIVGKTLSEFVAEPLEKLEDYLQRCWRGSHLTLGALTFKTLSGELVPCRCEGGMLPLDVPANSSVLVLRQLLKKDASRQFLMLNEQIGQLHRVGRELEKEIAIRTSDLMAAQSALRELSGKLLQAQDDERRRLARDLHDSTGQLLTAILLNLSVLMQDAASLPAETQGRLSETIDLANQAISEIRTMSYLLHPPMLDEAGLEMALQWYVEGFRNRSNIAVDLELPDEPHRLPREMELAVFRIVQECLTNIHRHSGSKTAHIRFAIEDGMVTLVIKDVGRGLWPTVTEQGNGHMKHAGVGIRGMRERVRQLHGTIHFEPGNPGTIVRVELPLTSAGTAERPREQSFDKKSGR
jgi:signal transduction histidine kinase